MMRVWMVLHLKIAGMRQGTDLDRYRRISSV